MYDALIDTHELPDGYKVRIFFDEVDDSSNPRDGDGCFLWLGFPHRHYRFGDEQFDPQRDVPDHCRECDGSGEIENDEKRIDCPTCGGSGGSEVTREVIYEHLRSRYGALVIRPIWCTDHSGLYFSLSDPHDRWDSGIAGLLVFTEQQATDWGLTDWTEEQIVEQMKAEIAYYDDWQRGNVYRFELYDLNGDLIESVGGFIGDQGEKDALEEAKACLPDRPPARLRDVRLTDAQIALVRRALGHLPTGPDLDDVLRLDLTLKEATR